MGDTGEAEQRSQLRLVLPSGARIELTPSKVTDEGAPPGGALTDLR